jgi:hypothetical protein
VLGSATDGGYYLLGVKRAHRHLFEDIAWSTNRVAEQTLQRGRELGLEMHVLAPWYDVDAAESLVRLHAELSSGSRFDPALQSYEACHTAQLMQSIFATNGLVDRLRGMDVEENDARPSASALGIIDQLA